MNQETRFDIFIELTDTKTDKVKLKTKMTEASSIEMADEAIFASYVRFCRDVARKPIERTVYANGIEWYWNGIKYRYFYLIQGGVNLAN